MHPAIAIWQNAKKEIRAARLGCGGAWAQHHRCNGTLIPFGMRYRNYARFPHRGMRDQSIFQIH